MTDVALSEPGIPSPSAGPVSAAGLLTAAAAAAGDRPAVTDARGRLTYSELEVWSQTAAVWLRRNGISRGDRVLLRLGNTREFVALLYGAMRAGATVIPVNPAMRPYQLSQVIADARPAFVITADAESVDAGTEVVPVRRILEEAGPDENPFPEPSPEDLALLIYTSGSTSAPKGVMCPHGRVVFAAKAVAARLRYRPDDIVLTASPLSFDYGLYQIFLSTLARAELLLADADAPVALMATLRASRATVVPIVPSLGEMLVRLAARGERPGHVRLFTNTGAALTPPTIAALRAQFPGASVAPMYGITECKRVCILEPDGDLLKPGSVGPAIPGTRVLILDEDGREVPAGVTGEIVAAGPHVMAGYWRAPELTARRFRTHPVTGENLLHTGDFGRLDADGHLYFAGRRDDQFKRRGMRMSAIEIEAAALDIDGVDAAALLPPDGPRDMVLVIAGPAKAAAVLDGIAERLEPAKVPSTCLVRAALPLTPNGKTDKKTLLLELKGAPDGD